MDKLFKGALDFKREDFKDHKGLFRDLGRGQKPHTLFIGCSDSRVVPTLITNTLPGELFMVRNVANIVPPFALSEKFIDTVSTIEYAVAVLDVDTILVCGHSNCGGCLALHEDPEELADMPNLQRWLAINKDLPAKVQELMDGGGAARRERLTEELNVRRQMEHLLTYPFIERRVAAGVLKILGWHYIIETGEVFNLNDETGQFELVEKVPNN